MKVIGLSGPQGAGKSSLLKSLVEFGWQVDDFKVARTVQLALGWDSLDRVLESPQTMIEFHDEIIKQKLAQDVDLMLSGSDSIILTERTFADIASYSLLWSQKLIDGGKWNLYDAAQFLIPFIDRCARAQDICYEGVIYLPFMEHITFEEDSHRAKEEDIDIFAKTTLEFLEKSAARSEMLVVTGKSIHDRSVEVHNFLKGF
jgi:hypothetical protein